MFETVFGDIYHPDQVWYMNILKLILLAIPTRKLDYTELWHGNTQQKPIRRLRTNIIIHLIIIFKFIQTKIPFYVDLLLFT